jgi:YbbR domain-containing protein
VGPEQQISDERHSGMLMAKHILRKVFFEDWMMKVVAFGITFALWLGVTGLSTPTTELIRNVPLSLRFSSDIDVTSSPPQQVDIVISGDKRRVALINRNDLVVSVDLTDVEPGERIVELTPENVILQLPTGVKLDEIQPNLIAMTLEPVLEKEVEVKVATVGDVENGYEVYSAAAVPPRVRVRGPASIVGSLETISTEKIELTGRKADFTEFRVSLVPPSASKATALERSVDVQFRIGERRNERLFLVRVDDGSGRQATVVLFGGRSLLIGLKPDDLSVRVVTNAAGVEVPELVLPPGFENRIEVRKLTLN